MNSKINTGLLAYGMSGKVFHAPFLQLHPGFELTGAWERSKHLIQQDYPEVKSYTSLHELLTDDIDLVVVNTPVDTHFEYAKKVADELKANHITYSYTILNGGHHWSLWRSRFRVSLLYVSRKFETLNQKRSKQPSSGIGINN